MEKQNKLIADFMGVKTISEKEYENKLREMKKENFVWYDLLHPTHQELNYHKSWDALLPVIRKIYQETLDNDFKGMQEELLKNDIKQSYNLVIEFIKKLNK